MTKKKDSKGKGKGKAKAENSSSQNDAVPPPSADIFKALFGSASAAPSIFSDDNPFKRKPRDPNTPAGDKVENLDAEGGGARENGKEEKKKKRNKEEEPDVGGDTEVALDLIAPKKTKTRSGSELGRQREESNEENKKKRKRDEVEREYEARKYGVVSGEEKEKVAVVVGAKRKKADAEAVEVLVSKDGEDEEGFDDEDKLLRTVFVGNLPLKVKKKVVLREFSKFGEIESVRIRSVPLADTKIPRKGAIVRKKINDAADSVHAYVVFKTQQSAEAALSFNMSVVEGKHIRVDRACPPRKKLKGESSSLYDTQRTVFLGNLPFDVKDEEIYQLFSTIKDLESSIEGVRVIRDSNCGLGKGIAYVLLKTKEAANLAFRKRDLKIRDRDLRISRAKQDSTPSKRKNSSPAGIGPNKKLATNSRTPDSSRSLKAKGVLSYQGLRANKAGDQGVRANKAGGKGGQKRVHMRNGAVTGKSDSRRGELRKEKRPSVAARKAKANVMKEDGAPKQEARKRKLGSRTPDSSYKTSKAKRIRQG